VGHWLHALGGTSAACHYEKRTGEQCTGGASQGSRAEFFGFESLHHVLTLSSVRAVESSWCEDSGGGAAAAGPSAILGDMPDAGFFLLIVDHGSRRAEAGALTRQLAEACQAKRPQCQVRVAHLEIEPPDVAAAIDACVAEGAREIHVQPFFLLPGRHTQEDLPRIAEEARTRHPGCAIHLGAALGDDPRMVDLLLARVPA